MILGNTAPAISYFARRRAMKQMRKAEAQEWMQKRLMIGRMQIIRAKLVNLQNTCPASVPEPIPPTNVTFDDTVDTIRRRLLAWENMAYKYRLEEFQGQSLDAIENGEGW